MSRATAVACANIALVKYWGNRDAALRLPLNDSLSMNLSDATTTTSVRFDPSLEDDRLTLDDRARHGPMLDRVRAHLDLVRRRADIRTHAAVRTHNTFPMGTGIASSASGFAALTVAACAAAGLALDRPALSALARRGSGSAARSVPGGFVWWHAGHDDASSYAEAIAPASHWELCDVVAVVSRRHKTVGSTDGHAAAASSPLLEARLAAVRARLPELRAALMDRDLARLGPLVEAEALLLHAVAMTSRPALLYWQSGTMALLHAVRAWRAEGLPAYFTLDAGPNVHLLCEARDVAALTAKLAAVDTVEQVLINRPGGPARLVDDPRPDGTRPDDENR